MGTMWGALRREEGQTAAEYIGVLMVLAAVIAALLLAAPGIGQTIVEGIRTALCQITGVGCQDTLARGEPLDPCLVSSTSGTADFNATIAFVDVGGGKGFLAEEFADGRIDVTFVDTSTLGASTGGKAGGSVTIGDNGVGLNAEARVAAALLGEGSDTRIFHDRGEARAYIRDRGLSEGIDALPGPAGDVIGGLRGFVHWMTGHQAPQGEEGRREASWGTGFGGDAEAAAGPLSAKVEAALGADAARTVDPDGSSSSRLQIDAEVAGKLGVPVLVQLGAGGASTVLVQLDVDANGDPRNLKMSAQVDGSFSAELIDNLDPGEALDALQASVTGTEGKRAVVELNVDLANRQVADAALGLIAQAPRVGKPTVDRQALIAAGGDLHSALTGNSTLSVVTYSLGGTGVEAEGGLMAGLGLDLEAGISVVTATADSASYLDPVTGRFEPWTCGRT